jgi:dynactin 5
MIYNPDIEFSAEEYIVTSTGNIISRLATICKPQTVEIPNGRCIICPEVIIRGDLAAVQLNKYCLVGARTVLHPCYTTFTPAAGLSSSSATTGKALKFIPQTIGSHCIIGEDCVISAAVIGTGCVIEDNCILSKRCIIKDYVRVTSGTVIPPDMVVPPFCIVSGNPAQIVGELPESTSTLGHMAAVERYKAYKLVSAQTLALSRSAAAAASAAIATTTTTATATATAASTNSSTASVSHLECAEGEVINASA